MKLFANEEAFQLALKRLNALTPVWDWHPKISRKVHEDIFGVQIKLREIYFKKQVGPSFHSVKKLSRTSMEKFLYLFVAQIPMVEAIAETLIAGDQQKLREAAMKLDALLGEPEDVIRGEIGLASNFAPPCAPNPFGSSSSYQMQHPQG